MKMVEINGPVKGLNEAYSYDDQPKGGFNQQTGVFGGGTTPRVTNVYAYDPRTGRRRISSRCGTSKYCSVQLNGSRSIQDINHVVGVTEGTVTRTLNTSGTLRTLNNGTFRTLSTPSGNTGERIVTVLGVAGGSIYVITPTAATLATNGGGALLSDAYTIFSQPYQLDIYYCDGQNYKVYDVSSAGVTTWEATEGDIPAGGTLICLFNGRLVVAGFKDDPQNYAMSAVDDARDFDFSPATLSDTMAVAGNNTQGAGLVGDLITALMPYRDDTMFFGCANSIYRMSGDPAAGGRIDLVSTITGVAWGRAFCMSPEGVMYFVGSRGGIYRMNPDGGVPQRITALVLDERFADLDMDDNLFRLEWDDRAIGVRIFITPKDSSDTTHYLYDLRNDAWWPITYANDDHNPLTTHLLDGYSSGERVILMGGQDGYIRMEDVSATTDDGQPIESEVWLGPMKNQMVMELQATFSNDTGNVNWAIHTAEELETALDSSAAASGRFTAGRNRSQWPRRRISQGYIRMASSEPWAMEKLVAGVELDTATRARIL